MLLEFIEQAVGRFGDGTYFGAGIKFEVYQHLVVARTPAVDFLSYHAQLPGKHKFYLRVYVFYAVFYYEFAFVCKLVDFAQFFQKNL